jgi:hypothetical protein
VDDINGHWHLKKEVSYGHLVSTAFLILAMVTGWVKVQTQLNDMSTHIGSPSHQQTERRLDLVEAELARMQVLDETITSRMDSMLQQALSSQAEIIRRLERIEDRLNSTSKTF